MGITIHEPRGPGGGRGLKGVYNFADTGGKNFLSIFLVNFEKKLLNI